MSPKNRELARETTALVGMLIKPSYSSLEIIALLVFATSGVGLDWQTFGLGLVCLVVIVFVNGLARSELGKLCISKYDRRVAEDMKS